MNLIVNGNAHEHHGAADIAALLKEMGTGRRRVAVLLNDHVVPAAAYASTRVQDGDRIELLIYAGGG
jgi:sulfur carrier protein